MTDNPMKPNSLYVYERGDDSYGYIDGSSRATASLLGSSFGVPMSLVQLRNLVWECEYRKSGHYQVVLVSGETGGRAAHAWRVISNMMQGVRGPAESAGLKHESDALYGAAAEVFHNARQQGHVLRLAYFHDIPASGTTVPLSTAKKPKNPRLEIPSSVRPSSRKDTVPLERGARTTRGGASSLTSRPASSSQAAE